MCWIVVALALLIIVIPFVVRRRVLQIALFIAGLSACGIGLYLLSLARGLERDAAAVHTYDLPAGDHGRCTILIRPPSQSSMEAVLVGIDGQSARKLFPDRPSLESCRWRLPAGVSAEWYEYPDQSGATTQEVKLFLVRYSPAPVLLEYEVSAENADRLKGVRLVVRHDDSARHLLLHHGYAMFLLFGLGAVAWGGWWSGMTVFRWIRMRQR